MHLFDVFKQGAETYIDRTSDQADEAKAALKEALVELESDFHQVMLSSDPNAIKFFEDRVAGRTARITNRTVSANAEVFAAIAAGVLRAGLLAL